MMTILLVVEQMHTRLESIHSKGIVHRDVKPENFMLKKQYKFHSNELEKARREYMPDALRQEVYLIDFGLSKKFLTDDGKHIPESKAKHFVGTAGFSSLNSHTLIE